MPTDVVDALIAGRLVDPAAREDSHAVVAGVLDSRQRPARGERESRGAACPSSSRSSPTSAARSCSRPARCSWSRSGATSGFGARVALLASSTAVLAGRRSRRAHGSRPAAPALRDAAHDVRRRLAGTLLTGAALARRLPRRPTCSTDWTTTAFPEVYWPAVARRSRRCARRGGRLPRRADRRRPGRDASAGASTAAINVIDGVSTATRATRIGVALFLLGAVWLGLTELGCVPRGRPSRARWVSTVALVGAQMPGDRRAPTPGSATCSRCWSRSSGIAVYLRQVAWPYLAGRGRRGHPGRARGRLRLDRGLPRRGRRRARRRDHAAPRLVRRLPAASGDDE